MDSIKTILLEYQRFAYLIPAVRFINLVRPKEIIMGKDEEGATYQGCPVNLMHESGSLNHSIYCAILQPVTADKEGLKTIIPLTKSPKPINLSSQQIAWHQLDQNLAVIHHSDYPGMIVKLL